jgi:hypothetical protein
VHGFDRLRVVGEEAMLDAEVVIHVRHDPLDVVHVTRHLRATDPDDFKREKLTEIGSSCPLPRLPLSVMIMASC